MKFYTMLEKLDANNNLTAKIVGWNGMWISISTTNGGEQKLYMSFSRPSKDGGSPKIEKFSWTPAQEDLFANNWVVQ